MRRLLWLTWGAGFAFVLVILACLGIVMTVGRPPIRFPQLQAHWKTEPPSIRIAVFGDTQKGLAGFAALAEKAKAEGISLAIHTGDLVSHADAGHYDLALTWVQRANLEVPFVVVP